MNNPRFRAIDPETGKVSEVFEVSPRHQMDIKDKSFYQFCCQGVTFITQSAPILSQSTGLTDARGNEVFEGDVLIIPVLAKLHKEISEAFRHGDIYVVEWVRYSWLAKTIYGADTRHPYNVGQDGAIIIGNRYQSQSTLEQRAREVMNG